MNYCIVNIENIIENIIVTNEAFAESIDALPCYDGAAIGETYSFHEPEPEFKTSSELREESYKTESVIEWDDNMLTVDAANALYLCYLAEGSEKADQLQVLIAEAKAEIREKYPD